VMKGCIRREKEEGAREEGKKKKLLERILI
jgi:hypothetical protein